MPKNYNLYLKGSVGSWNFNADMVSYVLDKHKNSEVSVLIDSLGGDVATALSISSLFKLHGNVHCHYVGMNASAATIASMGAKHISIDAHALFLVHQCMAPIVEWDYMNADELAAHIEELEKIKKDNETIDGCIAGMYALRCKKTKEELLALMKEGAWLTAQQAKEWGFVDEITNSAEDPKPELTDSVASVMADAGIPVPPIEIKKGSFLERLFKAIFPNVKPVADAQKAEATQPTPIMSKNYATLSSVMGETLFCLDGELKLTEEQADKLEAVVGNHNATIADLNEEISILKANNADLQGKIADLAKEPASETEAIQETSKSPNPLNGLDIAKVCDALCDGLF